jgi:general secretion pathway protein L
MLTNFNFSESINWWVKGLGYLCPTPLRKVFNASHELITIEFNEEKVLLKRFSEDSSEALETKYFETKDELERITVLKWLEDQATNNAQVILIVPDDFFLKKKMTYPKATASNLRQVLSFEMNRKTPFSPEQTYFDYLLIEQNEQTDKVNLELFLVPRNKIDPYLDMLKSWKISLDAIRPVMQYDNCSINLIAPEERQQSNAESDKMMLILTTATCLLFMLLLYAPIINQNKELKLLESEVAKSRKTALQLQSLKKNKEKLLKQSHFLKNKHINEMSSIKLIGEVTQIVPDDTWLTRFVMKSGELQLQGESSNASSLIQTLESSEYFTGVQFRSPVTQNKLSNKDKFHLSAKFTEKDS